MRGDTQSGHSMGIVNPETVIPEIDLNPEGKRVVVGYRHPDMRPIQKRLWAWSEEDRQNISKLAGKDEIAFLEMGDLTQGNRFTDDLAETALAPQVIMSDWLMRPWLEMKSVKQAYVVKGTGVHVWGEGSTETILTQLLKNRYPKKSIKIASHYLLSIDGFLMDVAHHGASAGTRNWTRGNMLRLYSESILRDCLDLRQPVPHALLRAHYHEFTYARAIHQTGGSVWEFPAWITFPYCFIGSHGEKAVKSPNSMGVGTLAFEIINGKLYDWHKFGHWVDLRARELL